MHMRYDRIGRFAAAALAGAAMFAIAGRAEAALIECEASNGVRTFRASALAPTPQAQAAARALAGSTAKQTCIKNSGPRARCLVTSCRQR